MNIALKVKLEKIETIAIFSKFGYIVEISYIPTNIPYNIIIWIIFTQMEFSSLIFTLRGVILFLVFVFCFGIILSSALTLLLAPYLGITPGWLEGPNVMPGIELGLSVCKTSALSPVNDSYPRL